MKLTDKIAEIAKPAAEKFGCELWDVEFAREGGQRFLRVFIDKEGGVGIEDCENVSRELDPLLDELDLIEESYTFEVSSAGLERPLKRPSDFEKFIGSKVFISLYRTVAGKKEHTGTLLAYEDGDVTMEISGRQEKFEKKDIARVRLSL